MDLLVLTSLNPTTAIGILSLTILLSFLFFRYSKVVSHFKEPPMVPGSWPILGHLLLFHGSQPLHITLGAMADKYGPLFTIKLGSTKIVVLSNSEMAKECFTKNDKASSSRPKLVAIENLSYNQAMFGFASYSPYWREVRKIVTLELLSNRRMELLRHVRVAEVQASTKELVNLWSTQKDESCGYVLVDIKQWFAELTFNMVFRMIAGKRFFGAIKSESEEKGERCVKLVKNMLRLLGVFTVGDGIPSLRWFDFGGHEKAMKEVAKELDKILTEWIEEHRQMMDLGVKDEKDRDFIDAMLSVISDAKIDTFDADTVIKATILNMIIGASETTTISMTWAMCLLLKNPHTFEKAKEELDKEIGNQRCVSESDINKLIYLQAIIKETLRLYPPAPLTATHEFSENCNLGGYHIKKGTQLIANLSKINNDPCLWSNHLEFMPEKFLTTHKDVDVRGHHFELLPFGSGRRVCPGISFGLQMIHFSLASFLHYFEISIPPDEPIDMSGTPGLVHAKATPLKIMVKPRLSSTCYETM